MAPNRKSVSSSSSRPDVVPNEKTSTSLSKRNQNAPQPPVNKRIRQISVRSQDSMSSVIFEFAKGEVDDLDSVSDSVVAAPDGGWGWVILVASFFCFVMIGFQFGGVAVTYVALVEYFDADRGVAGWIGSLYNFAGNFLGIMIGALVQRFGCRLMSVVGGLVGGLGIALSGLLVNIPYLYLTYGIIGGIGNAMVFIPSIVILQRYFDKRRALAIGIGGTGISVGGMVATPIIGRLLDVFGLSGMYLISAGLWLQIVVFSMLYRPLGTSRKSGSVFRDLVDFSPLRNRRLVLFLVGTFMFNLSAIPFYAHFMSRAVFLGIERHVAIKLQILLASMTGVSRIIFSFVGNIQGVNRVLAYGILVMAAGLTVISVVAAKVVWSLAVYAALMGFFSGGMFTIQPTVLVDISGVKQIAKTTGFLNMAVSLAILIGIPLEGFVFDMTGNYDYPFFVSGSLHLVGAAVLIALAVLHTRRQKTTEHHTSEEESDCDA